VRATVGSVWRTRGTISSERQDWATPIQLLAFLKREFEFRLDVCATAASAKAPKYFNRAEDGLEMDWLQVSVGEPIWMNPPYGREIGKWIRKAWEESRRGCTVVCLLPARTDTSWWHDYCMKAAEIRFLRGRLCFDDDKRKRAPFPSAIVVFRPPEPAA